MRLNRRRKSACRRLVIRDPVKLAGKNGQEQYKALVWKNVFFGKRDKGSLQSIRQTRTDAMRSGWNCLLGMISGMVIEALNLSRQRRAMRVLDNSRACVNHANFCALRRYLPLPKVITVPASKSSLSHVNCRG